MEFGGVVHAGPRQRALVSDGEPAHLVHLVAEELHPDGVVLGGWEHVDDAAADGKLAAVGDHVHPRIGGIGEAAHHVGERHVLANLERDRNQFTQSGDDWLDHGTDRRHHNPQRARRRSFRVRQAAQDRQPPAHRVRAG